MYIVHKAKLSCVGADIRYDYRYGNKMITPSLDGKLLGRKILDRNMHKNYE